MSSKKIAFVAADFDEAQRALETLQDAYVHTTPEEADVIVALGGDGFMLRTLHRYMKMGRPIFGMNRGSVGFLLNEHREDNLLERLDRAQVFNLAPLRMEATSVDGTKTTALAINEVSLFRESGQAARIKVTIDGVVRLEEIVCDGVLVSTPAGSTAYNSSVYGPILPLGSAALALTAISAYRPRRWRGALLPHTAVVTFEILHPAKRPVGVNADYTEVRDVTKVTVYETNDISPILMFDPEHNLEERIIAEQFRP